MFLTTGRRAIDQNKRTKVPYGFATDGWADLGNLSVYRHDNGTTPPSTGSTSPASRSTSRA